MLNTKMKKIASLILASTIFLVQIPNTTKIYATEFQIKENWSVEGLYPIHSEKTYENYSNLKWINSIGNLIIVTNSKEDSEKYLDSDFFYRNPDFAQGTVSIYDENGYSLITTKINEDYNKNSNYQLKGKMGLINNGTGQIVKAAEYDYIHIGLDYPSKDVAVLKKGKDYELYNASTNTFKSMPYEFVGDFKQGLALVRKDGKYGYINTNGALIIPLKFDSGTFFNKYGVAKVIVNKKYGVIDLQGNYVFKPNYGPIDRYTNSFISLGSFKDPYNKTNPFKIVNKNGKTVYTESMDEENLSKTLVDYKLSGDSFVVGHNDNKNPYYYHTDISFYDLDGKKIVENTGFCLNWLEPWWSGPNPVFEHDNSLYLLRSFSLINSNGKVIVKDLSQHREDKSWWTLYDINDETIINLRSHMENDERVYENYLDVYNFDGKLLSSHYISLIDSSGYYSSPEYSFDGERNYYYTLGYKYFINNGKLYDNQKQEYIDCTTRYSGDGEKDFSRMDLLDGRVNLKGGSKFKEYEMNNKDDNYGFVYYSNISKNYAILTSGYYDNQNKYKYQYYLAPTENINNNELYKNKLKQYDYIDFTFPSKGDALVVDGNKLSNVSIIQ